MKSILQFTNKLISNEEFFSFVLIISIIVLLIIIYHRFFKRKQDSFLRYIRHFLLPFTCISGFAVYFIGYQFGSEADCSGWRLLSNFLESIFSTTRLFILGNDFVELEAPFKHGAIFHGMFALTAALAAFIFIAFVVQIFFKDFLTRHKILRRHFDENHLFFGINHATLSLASDLLKSNDKRLVVFVDDVNESENHKLYNELPSGAYVIKRASFFESISLEKDEGIFQLFQKQRNHKLSEGVKGGLFYHLNTLLRKLENTSTHLYFLTDEEDWNIEHANLALNEINALLDKKKIVNVKSIRIHTGTHSEISAKHFVKYIKLNSNLVTVSIHNYASIVTRQLIAEHHPVDSVEIDNMQAISKSDFNVLVIGFGQIGNHILRKLIEQGQFVGSDFHATIIDKYMGVLQGRFEYLYPGIPSNYNLSFVEAEAGHTKFYKEIKNIISYTNYIVISLGNDNLNIQTALEILEICHMMNEGKQKIFVHLEDEKHWKDTLKEYEGLIYIFGEVHKVYSEKNILQPDKEAQGERVHEVYRKLYGDNRLFSEISRHEQLSNISVAEHLYAKVKLLGYKNADDFSSHFSNSGEYINSLTNVQRLNLSKGEHLRWNAFYFVHGWTTIPLEEIEGETIEEKYNNRKNTALKRHSCLTSWENLEKLKGVIGEDMQKADIDSVLNLFNFINYNPQDNASKIYN
ncbi:hypothetical protein [Paludibacter sp.]|uniref:hypothetical protein n=1 Tax=Paludibacter sp. TaxID=1898105 RepID=UPI0013547EB0|nr:hypothetical protein [Paludibacter sp.]MTK53108.1 hypothetical protein [Paludibacter sp.]